MNIRRVFKQLLTESDNVTHDIYRYLAIISIVTGLTLMVYAVVVKGQLFSIQDFGIGVGVLFAGVGVALGLKNETSIPPKGMLTK